MSKNKKKSKPRPKTLHLNIVIPVTVTCENNSTFDIEEFDNEFSDDYDFDIQNMVSTAVQNNENFEGGHSVGIAYVEEVTDVDRQLEKLGRLMKTRLRIMRKELESREVKTEVVRRLRRAK